MKPSLVLALTALAGCVDVPEDDVAPPADVDVTPVARITANAIVFGDIVATKEVLGQLSHGKLALDTPAGQALLATPSGRQTLRFLVSCALPEGRKLTEPGCHGETFHGQLNLAPHWGAHAPTASELRWVSACMLARVNNAGRAMKISVHGAHAGLAVNNQDRQTFTLEEGAFYGDIFTGSAPLVGWSCRGTAQAQGDPDGDTALNSRDCAEPGDGATLNRCGWGYAGDCGASACGGKHGGNDVYYTSCHGAGGSGTWAEVITTFVNDGAPID